MGCNIALQHAAAHALAIAFFIPFMKAVVVDDICGDGDVDENTVLPVVLVSFIDCNDLKSWRVSSGTFSLLLLFKIVVLILDK
jgi:hypothetical protein